MGQSPIINKTAVGLYKLVDIKQPEVKWALGISILLESFFVAISFQKNFLLYENEVCGLIQCIIAGLISLIGVAIAGIAIVITLYNAEQVKLIEKLYPGAFKKILYDFKWFALVSTLETAIFIAIIFLIKTPYAVIPTILFYIITFILIYGVFYLLFYGCALIGNFIKMAQIKYSLDTALVQSKNIPLSATELQLDFLVAKLFSNDKQAAHKFYEELIELLERGSMDSKAEIIEYLKKRYTNF